MTLKEEKVTRLEDLEVKEVSMVDRGANLRTLLVVKNAGDKMPDAFDQAAADAQSGKVIAADDPNARDDGQAEVEAKKPDFLKPGAKAEDEEDGKKPGKKAPPFGGKGKTDKDSDPVVEAQAAQASEDTQLIVGMDEATKAAFSSTLQLMENRLGALRTAVESATSDANAQTSQKLVNEIAEVSGALGRLAATDKAAEVIAAMAKGSDAATAQISMAQMEMTKNGPVFQMPMEMALPMCCEAATKSLYQAADALMGEPDMGKACGAAMKAMKMLGPFMSAPMSAEYGADFDTFKQYAFNQPQGSIPAGVPNDKLPEGMIKAGKKISGANLSKLEELFAELGTTLEALRPTEIAKGGTPSIAKLEAHVAKLTTIAKTQHAELTQLRGARPAGHASSQGEADELPSLSGKTVWPDDLNEPVDPDLRF